MRIYINGQEYNVQEGDELEIDVNTDLDDEDTDILEPWWSEEATEIFPIAHRDDPKEGEGW